MYNILTLNKISKAGLSRLGDNYNVADSVENPDAVLVRSASMHDMELPSSLLAIARAGAGVVNTSLPADQISAFSLFLSFSLSVYKSIGAFRPHSCFPVTIQIKLDQRYRLNLFLSYLQRIAFLGELLGQRSRHESLRRPLIEPVRRHIVLNTFGSLESRDFRTRKNPSINRFSLAVSSLPHIPY